MDHAALKAEKVNRLLTSIDLAAIRHPDLKVLHYDGPMVETLRAHLDKAVLTSSAIYPEDICLHRLVERCVRRHAVTDVNDASFAWVPVTTQHMTSMTAPQRAQVLAMLGALNTGLPHLMLDPTDVYSRPGFEGDDGIRELVAQRKASIFDWLDGRFVLLTLDSSAHNAPGDIGILPFCARSVTEPLGHRPLDVAFVGTVSNEQWPGAHLRGTANSARWKGLAAMLGDRAFIGGANEARDRFRCAEPYYDVPALARYGLCPRGFGGWTYRFLETALAGALPVVISDGFAYPFASQVPWDDFCLRIAEEDLSDLPEVLRAEEKAYAQRACALRAHQPQLTATGALGMLCRELERHAWR